MRPVFRPITTPFRLRVGGHVDHDVCLYATPAPAGQYGYGDAMFSAYLEMPRRFMYLSVSLRCLRRASSQSMHHASRVEVRASGQEIRHDLRAQGSRFNFVRTEGA